MKPRRTNILDDVWLTPPAILKPLGIFDLDPCAAIGQPWATAKKHFTIEDDGLEKKWFGRVWLNPPYSNTGTWMSKMARHANGMALVNARTETSWFLDGIWNAAWALIFVRRKIKFVRTNGLVANQGWNASVIAAYSEADAKILHRSGIEGKFIPLIIKFAFELRSTWRQLVRFFLKECGGTATLEQLYELASGHPKALSNPNWKAKIRQQVQSEAVRVGPALWQTTFA